MGAFVRKAYYLVVSPEDYDLLPAPLPRRFRASDERFRDLPLDGADRRQRLTRQSRVGLSAGRGGAALTLAERHT